MLRFKGFIYLTIFFALQLGLLSGQILDPVSWSFDVESIGADRAELKFKATMDPGWHLYALNLPSDDGPIPTSFTFDASPQYALIGKVKQGKYKTEYDPNFMMNLNYFEGVTTFTQTVERNANDPFSVKGEVEYMACNNVVCIAPTIEEFDLKVEGKIARQGSVETGSTQLAMQPGMLIDAPKVNAPDDDGIHDPVQWDIRIEDETDTSAVIVGVATIAQGWYMYSLTVNPDDGPIPTSLTMEVSSGLALPEPLEESAPLEKYDPIFEMQLAYFQNTATFRQRVRKISAEAGVLKGYFTYQVCDDFKCLPPEDANFEFTLKPGTAARAVGSEEGTSNWLIFLWSFLSGFAALLTPCVFPMIPLTVSFFTKQSKTKAAGIRNAGLYGISIIAIYVTLGIAVTAAFGAGILSELSTDPWFNLFFFALLIFFAISFLGAFEISLPASWINKADSQADRGGLIGIFFMAFTLALVSFSCTGPIVGWLLVEAASKGGWAPTVGMVGFSLAIALPFTLFAAFPGWLNSLPQSGGWLNSVKVTLGFLELAFAFKFLSNADMVLQLHLLEREVFIAIWIVVFTMLTFYLLGKLKLSHDSDLPYISVTRLMLALFTGTFVVYMIPGLWGAPLKLISAFPPPMQYSESPLGVGYIGGTGSSESAPIVAGQHLGPQNIYAFHDYELGLAYAKEVGKPALIDFTGHACVNCRKMEQQVWSDPEIRRKLAEDVVLISLYVDEKTPLPEEERKEVTLTGGRKKKLRNTGHKWAVFQELRYGVNAQPYYVLLDHNEAMLNNPANYQDFGTIEKFNNWLTEGMDKFKK